MGSWKDTYDSIVNYLEKKLTSILEEYTQDTTDKVIVSKAAPKAYPSVYIWPGRIRERPTTSTRTEVSYTFTIHAVSDKDETLEIIDKVRDVIVSDRTLGGTVDNCEVDHILPDAHPPRAIARYESEITIVARKVIV